jgi:UDP-GlcNAc:undecaprenyl-phosphate GlcNAc-1-phosphate transferase
MNQYLVSFAIAFASSLVLTGGVRWAARKLSLVAKPRADRWHRKPTALYGGVGIYLSFMAISLLDRQHGHGLGLLMACASAMFVLGLVDDVVQLKPYAKFVGQIICAAAFTMFGMRLNWIPIAPVDQALTVFWLVGITNAVNLLDSLDGVAGGVAAIASAFLIYFSHSTGQGAAAAMSAAFCGAVAGFLVYNFNPASIFMGDCGSLFLGFYIGGAALIHNQPGLRRNVVAILSIPLLVVAVPIIDTTLVTISRKYHGRAVSQGGRDHTAHRLVALGLSERAAALTLWAVAACSGGIAVLVRNLPWTVGAFVVPAFALGLVFFVIYLGRVRVYEPVTNESEARGRALIPTLADFTYKRRIFEVLNDLVVIVLAYYGAYLLRFDGGVVLPYYQRFLDTLPFVIAAQLGGFLALGLYKGLWRYTSMSDVSTLLRSVAGGWLASVFAILFAFRLADVSRGMLIIDAMLLLLGIGGTRIMFRLLRTWIARYQPHPSAKRVLIYGAGDGGELLLRELQNNRDLKLHPVGFVDDDPQKHGRVIHGVPVLGPLDRLKELAGSAKADELVISTTKIPVEQTANVAVLCQSAGLHCRRMRIALE